MRHQIFLPVPKLRTRWHGPLNPIPIRLEPSAPILQKSVWLPRNYTCSSSRRRQLRNLAAVIRKIAIFAGLGFDLFVPVTFRGLFEGCYADLIVPPCTWDEADDCGGDWGWLSSCDTWLTGIYRLLYCCKCPVWIRTVLATFVHVLYRFEVDIYLKFLR